MPPPPPFEVIMPEIESRSRRHYSRLPAAAQDEAVQESVCQAFALYDSAVARQNFRFTPASLAIFANRAVDEGRKFAGGTIKRDAMDRKRAVSFEDLDFDGWERICEALVRRQTPVLDQVRIRHDWPLFLSELPERSAWIVDEIAAGTMRKDAALELGLSSGRVTQIMDEVAEAYEERFGTPGFEHRARKQQKRKPRKARAAA